MLLVGFLQHFEVPLRSGLVKLLLIFVVQGVGAGHFILDIHFALLVRILHKVQILLVD